METVKAAHEALDLFLLNKRVVDRGRNHGWGHGIDADLVVRQFHGEMLCEGMEAGLGHRVGRARGGLDCLLGPHGADHNDGPAAVVLHVLRDGLGDEEGGLVELVVRVVITGVVLEERLGGEDAGGDDEVLQADVVGGGDALDDGRPGLDAGEVGLPRGDRGGLGGELRRSGELLLAAPHDDDVHAAREQELRRGEPHAGAPAEDECCVACHDDW